MNTICGSINRGHRDGGPTALKISKRHFLRDIQKSFQEITPMGPEPRNFFSF